MIAAANLWLFFYTPGLGVLDQIGSMFGLPSVNWLGQPETALWAIIIVTIWKEAGFFMIFYLAALQTIPEDLKEAADIEGTSRWTYTRRIVLPLLMPTTLFIAVNAMINSVKLIDHLFILDQRRTFGRLQIDLVLHLGNGLCLFRCTARSSDDDPCDRSAWHRGSRAVLLP